MAVAPCFSPKLNHSVLVLLCGCALQSCSWAASGEPLQCCRSGTPLLGQLLCRVRRETIGVFLVGNSRVPSTGPTRDDSGGFNVCGSR